MLGRDPLIPPKRLLRYGRREFVGTGEAYLGHLLDLAALAPGHRVLDVGCGPGRHAHELARRGIDVVGVDISERFVDLASRDAPPTATFQRCDARNLPYEDEFDAVLSLCQGAFGLVGEEDHSVLQGMARAARADGSGRIALTAFSAYFALRYLDETDHFDAEAGVNHERAVVKNEIGEEAEFDLWTSCFTPRELRLLFDRNGLHVEHLWSVTPGAYDRTPPDIDHPEFLVVARKPAVGTLS